MSRGASWDPFSHCSTCIRLHVDSLEKGGAAALLDNIGDGSVDGVR